jgi:hypothetical protein
MAFRRSTVRSRSAPPNILKDLDWYAGREPAVIRFAFRRSPAHSGRAWPLIQKDLQGAATGGLLVRVHTFVHIECRHRESREREMIAVEKFGAISIPKGGYDFWKGEAC